MEGRGRLTGDDRVTEPALGNLYGIAVIRVRQGIEVAGDDGFAGMEFRVPCEVGIAQRGVQRVEQCGVVHRGPFTGFPFPAGCRCCRISERFDERARPALWHRHRWRNRPSHAIRVHGFPCCRMAWVGGGYRHFEVPCRMRRARRGGSRECCGCPSAAAAGIARRAGRRADAERATVRIMRFMPVARWSVIAGFPSRRAI